MPADSAWNHRSYLDKQEDPRGVHRVHERDQESTRLCKLGTSDSCEQRSCTGEECKTGQRTRGECKAEPLHPFTKVIREGDEGIHAAMRDRVVGPWGLLVIAVQLLCLAFGDGLAAYVEQDLIVVHVACKTDGPKRNACPKARRGKGTCQVRCSRGGREEAGEEEAVWHVEGDGGADYGQVGA